MLDDRPGDRRTALFGQPFTLPAPGGIVLLIKIAGLAAAAAIVGRRAADHRQEISVRSLAEFATLVLRREPRGVRDLLRFATLHTASAIHGLDGPSSSDRRSGS